MADAGILERLERLERDNRRLKRLGAAALVIAAALGTMAATRPVPNRVIAHGFDLVDDAGVVRASLVMEPPAPASLSAQARKAVGPPEPALILERVQHPGQGATLDAGGLSVIRFNSAGHLASAGLKSSGVYVFGDKPYISLTDWQGFSMDLGSTNTEDVATGESRQTSAASIVMFGNDKRHRVIWQAPSDPARAIPRAPSSPPSASPPASPAPAGLHSASILSVHASGAYLKLDDGTAYIVDAVDRVNSAIWLVGDNVIVDSASTGCSDTRIINTDEDESVCASPVR